MSRNLIALALQGGGSHGAYTWGVLDRLLEDGGSEIEAISGASAGAMNAAVLAHGYAAAGAEGAREALDAFWTAVSERSRYGTVGAAASPRLADPATRAYITMTRYLSPYQLNPLNLNPLRDVLEEQVDFERLRAESPVRLFISTTRVRDGSLRIFREDELSADVLLASACVPSIHHTVEIDGDAYWDGGLAANPPLAPLVYGCTARQLLVVVLTAAVEAVPSSADAILERCVQIGFASTLSLQLQALALAKGYASRSRLGAGRLDRRLRALQIDLLESGRDTAELDPGTRFRADPAFVNALRDAGRSRADAWLTESRGARRLHQGSRVVPGVIDAARQGECPAG
jgi:NTE family protein